MTLRGTTPTCVRMYDLVQKYWADEINALKERIKSASQQDAQELERKLQWMQETEMAVVISQEQNEVQSFQKWGLDIQSHRAKMEKRELDKEFKDADNPLRVVFVCAMWLTGFDVKCLSCLYLDKPLKAHTDADHRPGQLCGGGKEQRSDYRLHRNRKSAAKGAGRLHSQWEWHRRRRPDCG